MGADKPAVSFDDIIRAGRQKKRNEELASQILGKNRRASAPGSGGAGKTQNATTPGSLASRVGVTKQRSLSTSSKPKKNKPFVSAAPPTAPKGPRWKSSTRPAKPAKPARAVRTENNRRAHDERLMTALDPASGQSTVRDNTGGGLSIKGASSGPFVITGSNFAQGTTAADIQSALEPIAGPILNCWIVGQYPTVTAEITFAEKWSAENTIANFHNQKADGRVLSMRWKQTEHSYPGYNSQASFNNAREQADRQRRFNRRVDPAVQDGRYGFDDDYGLYSDQMMMDVPAQDTYRGRSRR